MTASNGSERQIVVTGIGLMSPIGIGTDAFWSNLSGGQSGIARATLIDFVAAPDNIVGEVSEFTVSAAKKIYLKKQRKSIKVMCREIQLGVASAMQAIDQIVIITQQLCDTRRHVFRYRQCPVLASQPGF